MQILFVTFFNFFVFYLHVDIVGTMLLNASLLLVLMIDYSDWLLQVTQLIDSWQWQSSEFWVIIRLFVDFGMFVFAVGSAGLHNFYPALKFLTTLIFFNRD